MWHLQENPPEEISYEIQKEGIVEEELTGNTVLLASAIVEQDKSKIGKVILPILLIPIIVGLIIYFGTINIRKRK